MAGLSVTVITRNEADNIDAALASVSWAAEVIVVDAHSDDETVAIARRRGATVTTRDWQGFGSQKNHAATLAHHDWILSIDADERVTPALAQEISDLLTSDFDHRGYRIPRVAYHLGRWIRSTDWYPDYQLRLYDRRCARWTERPVHESVRVAGSAGMLRHELHHLPYRDISHHLSTIDRYTTLAARQLHNSGRRAGLPGLLLHPPLAFARNYVMKTGFRDGIPGFIVSALNAYYVLLKHAKLWELQQRDH